jgi:hypothetical protein
MRLAAESLEAASRVVAPVADGALRPATTLSIGPSIQVGYAYAPPRPKEGGEGCLAYLGLNPISPQGGAVCLCGVASSAPFWADGALRGGFLPLPLSGRIRPVRRFCLRPCPSPPPAFSSEHAATGLWPPWNE